VNTFVNVNGREWEIITGLGPLEPRPPHRRTDKRKEAVIEKAFATMTGNNFTEVAKRFHKTYYADDACENELSIEYRNQVKNIAKKLRKCSSKR
jgi:hypothetical protein